MPNKSLHRLTDHKELSAQGIAELFRSHSRCHDCVIDNDYQIKANTTLACIDYSQSPIWGKYKTVVLDTKRNFVLTTQSTKQLSNTIYKFLAIGGKSLQKRLAELLEFTYLHGISLGHSAFFSLNGHSTRNTSWVALHLLESADIKQDVATFSTLEIDGIQLELKFEQIKRHLKTYLKQSLAHNYLFHQVLEEQFKDRWCLMVKPNKLVTKSLIYDYEQFYKPKVDAVNSNLIELLDWVKDSIIIKAYLESNIEFGGNICQDTIKYLLQMINRRDYNG